MLAPFGHMRLVEAALLTKHMPQARSAQGISAAVPARLA